jgi:SAM-dependent methyltransferase
MVNPVTVPADGSDRLVPPEAFREIVGSATEDAYIAAGENFFRLFTQFGGLRPTDRVLDVGCGCGRMARPLTGYLTTGSYDGFDIIPELVAWCRDNVTPRYPNFRFLQVDVANGFYYRSGAGNAREFRFPYPDAQFDFTILASVFTHLLMRDFERYLDEVTRTLKPGGVALMTFFLLNEESRRLQATPRSELRFVHPVGRGLRVTTLAAPEAAVAYPEPLVRSVMRARGMEVQQLLLGRWCGREKAASWQDIVVARRMSGGPDGPLPLVERLKPYRLRLARRLRRLWPRQ